MAKVSVVLITLNEESNLERCLNSIKDLADEIIIVDSGSVDKTLEIARKFKPQTFFRKFDNFQNQRNWAMQKATGDWIFSIDADEVITEAAVEEIKEVTKKDKYDGFLMPRRNFILGAEIKYSRWSPDKHIWLWKKTLGKYVGEVHEELIVNGKVGELKNPKIHYQDKTISEFFSSNQRYAQLRAEEMQKDGVRFSIFRFFWDPIFEFSLRFIYKKGFLDTWRGLVLSLLMAIYKMDIWRRLLILQLSKK